MDIGIEPVENIQPKSKTETRRIWVCLTFQRVSVYFLFVWKTKLFFFLSLVDVPCVNVEIRTSDAKLEESSERASEYADGACFNGRWWNQIS